MKTMKLCCGRSKCPIVVIDTKATRISDDYGNTVILEHNQWELLKKRITDGVA